MKWQKFSRLYQRHEGVATDNMELCPRKEYPGLAEVFPRLYHDYSLKQKNMLRALHRHVLIDKDFHCSCITAIEGIRRFSLL